MSLNIIQATLGTTARGQAQLCTALIPALGIKVHEDLWEFEAGLCSVFYFVFLAL